MGFLTTKNFQDLYNEISPNLPKDYFEVQKAKQIATNNVQKFVIEPNTPAPIDDLIEAIARAETGGVSRDELERYSFKRYSGKKQLGYALGKYGVTEGELKTYSQRYLGRNVSAEEFLNNPALQDAYMENKLTYWRERGIDDDNLIALHRGGLNAQVSQYQDYVNKVKSYLPTSLGFPQVSSDFSPTAAASVKAEMTIPTEGIKPLLKSIYKSWPVQLAKTTLEAATAPLEVIDYPTRKAAEPIVGKKLAPLVGFAATMLMPGGELKGPAEVTELEKTVAETANLIRNSIKEIRPLREAMEEAYSAERAKRFALAEELYSRVGGGEEGIRAAFRATKGTLLTAEQKAELAFKPLRDVLSSEKIKILADAIWQHPLFTTGDKLTVSNGLMKLLEGEVPQISELAKMEDVFGPEIPKAILAAQQFGWGEKIAKAGSEIMDMARSIITSGDLSMVLGQGLLYTIKHPIKASGALKQAVIEAFSPQIYREWFTNVLAKDPVYLLARERGIAPEITKAGKIATLGEREEYFRSRFVDNIPVLGQIIGASERAYSGFLNKARYDLWKDGLRVLQKQGYNINSESDWLAFKSLSEVVNAFTGRGSLGELEKNMKILNKALFAPRFFGSRLFQILNPVWYVKLPKPVRMIAVQNLGMITSFWGGLAMAAKAVGFNVELNPLSTDFLKIRVGDTRYDMSGGLQPYIRSFVQIALGARKDTETGQIKKCKKFLGEDLGQ